MEGREKERANYVRDIIDNQFHGSEATDWGIKMEPFARRRLEDELKQPVYLCGLLVHSENQFLGGSPDGLVGKDTVVEIKCPFTFKDLSTEEVEKIISEGKIDFHLPNGDLKEINYQVQGQLELTNRKNAIFVVYSPSYFRKQTIKR